MNEPRATAHRTRVAADDRARRRAEWRLTWTIAAVVAVPSFVFGTIIARDEPWLGGVQGVLTSILISVPVSQLELAGHRWRPLHSMRDWPLYAVFAAKIAIYFVLIVAGTDLARLLMLPFTPQTFGFDELFLRILIFASIMSFVTNAVIEVGRLLGFGVLKDLLTGRYHRPRREERVLLLVDMKRSTSAAERLEDLLFHELLNEFFRDVADAALDHRAGIHKYVGDEAILTWHAEDAIRHARCVRCAFALGDRIGVRADEYRRRFGLVPDYRAALHIGPVVVGEMGDLKREIAFVGDTLNTAARLLAASGELGRDVLASSALLDRIDLPEAVEVDVLEPIPLRGKEQPLPIHALRERDAG